MARNRMLADKPDIFPTGYPELYVQDILNAKDYSDLVGPGSWQIFKVIGLEVRDLSWLVEPETFRWRSHASYRILDMFVKNMAFVDDAAEGEVKIKWIRPERRTCDKI